MGRKAVTTAGRRQADVQRQQRLRAAARLRIVKQEEAVAKAEEVEEDSIPALPQVDDNDRQGPITRSRTRTLSPLLQQGTENEHGLTDILVARIDGLSLQSHVEEDAQSTQSAPSDDDLLPNFYEETESQDEFVASELESTASVSASLVGNSPQRSSAATTPEEEDNNEITNASTTELVCKATCITCDCERKSTTISNDGSRCRKSLREMADYIASGLPDIAKQQYGEQQQHDPPSFFKRAEYRGGFPDTRWEQILIGRNAENELPPVLSYAESEQRCLASLTKGVQFIGNWDIDSFVGSPTSLAVFAESFNLSYRPTFSQNISQSQHMKIAGKEAHHLKHLYLGNGALGMGFGIRCHVFFPNMASVKPEYNFLTEQEMKVWYDGILIPAMWSTCSPNTRQHHPRSFREAKFKSKPKLEYIGDWQKEDIRLQATIRDIYLNEFWTEVLQNADNIGQGFEKPTLLISCHDIKLNTQSSSAEDALHKFNTIIGLIFNDWHRYCKNAFWYDLGCETMAFDIEQRQGLTLLPKTGCCNSWTSLFESPTGSAKLKTAKYPIQMTKDAGTTDFETSATNVRNHRQGIMHGKFYASHKDIFSTPVKGYVPFDNEQLALLAFSDDSLQRLAKTLSKTNSLNKYKREALKKMYSQCKDRVLYALHATQRSDFGIRKELRFNHFAELQLDPTRTVINPMSDSCQVQFDSGQEAALRYDSDNDDKNCCELLNHGLVRDQAVNKHLPFWILPTTEVNYFMKNNLRRWMWVIENLAVQTQLVPNLITPSLEVQLINNSLMTAAIKILSTTAGSRDPSRSNLLWQSSWRIHQRGPRRNNAETSEDSEEDEDGDLKRKVRWGLGFRDQLAETGMAWMRNDILDCTNVRFTQQAIKHLPLRNWRMRRWGEKSRFGGQRVQQSLNQTAVLQREFRLLCREADLTDREGRNDLLETAAELVVSAFVREIWSTLSKRLYARKSTTAQPDIHPSIKKRLSKDELAGFEGLSLAMVERATGQRYAIARPRRSRREAAGAGYTGRQAYFEGYDSGIWNDKLEGLFALEDRELNVRKRAWDNLPYRVLCQQLGRIILEEVGESGRAIVDAFPYVVVQVAEEKLQIAPLYNINQFSVLKIMAKHQPAAGQDRETELSPIERTQWMIPYDDGVVGDEIRHYLLWFRGWSKEKAERKRQELRRRVDNGELPLSLSVVSSVEDERVAHWSRQHLGIGGKPIGGGMVKAQEFMDRVEGILDNEGSVLASDNEG